MKKYISLIMLITGLFIILSVNIVWAENINFQEDDENICFDTIPIYFIYGSNLEICLSEPSIDKLDKLSYSKYVSAKYVKNNDYIYFNGYSVENGISKKCTEKYKVAGPYCSHDLTEYFSYFVLFIHRVSFGGKSSVFTLFVEYHHLYKRIFICFLPA